MINKLLILSLFYIVHFIADFMFQTDWMATNKSKSLYALLIHCITYSSFFIGFIPCYGLPLLGWIFASHFITDFFTSKITAYLYDKNRHQFFVVIGFDQLIHNLTLLLLFAKYAL